MTSPDTLIGRGVRAPDFALPLGSDGPTRFYGLVGGMPTVLLFAADGGGESRDEERGQGGLPPVTEVASQLIHTAEQDLKVHVVSRRTDEPHAFADLDGLVHEAYGVGAGEGPVVVVLDHAVRVATTRRLAELEDPAPDILELLPEPPEDHGLAPRLAPVLYVPDALSPAWCELLMERWTTDGAVETGVETVVEGERAEATDVRRKRRRDLTVTDQEMLRELTRHIGRRIMPELEQAFAFAAGGFEGFKIGCYDAADYGFFAPHRDNLSAGTAHRRFGLTVNLNDDYEGGELRFPEYGATRYRPAAGEALLFSGSHLHEVLPVESGRRFALLSFVLARGSRRS